MSVVTLLTDIVAATSTRIHAAQQGNQVLAAEKVQDQLLHLMRYKQYRRSLSS